MSSKGKTTNGGGGGKDREYVNVTHAESCTADENGNIDPELAETMHVMQQQDETLKDLDMAVTQVEYMAGTMHEEIGTPNMIVKIKQVILTE